MSTWLILVAVLSAEPPADVVDQFVAASQQLQQDMPATIKQSLKDAEQQLQWIKRGRIERGRTGTSITSGPRGIKIYAFASAEAKEEYVARHEESIDELKRRLTSIEDGSTQIAASLPYTDLDVGMMGRLVDDRLRVVQVVDGQNVLGKVNLKSKYAVVDPRDQFWQKLVWVKTSTAGMTDDSVADLPHVFWISGTKQYATAGGASNTVLVLEEVDASKWLKPKVQAPEFRVWTDASGTYRTEAQMIGVDGGVVQLKKRDGETVRVPLTRLSDRDKQYLTNHVGGAP